MQLASPYVNNFELSSTFKLLPPKCNTLGLLRDNFTSHFGRGGKNAFILQDEEVSYHREPDNISRRRGKQDLAITKNHFTAGCQPFR
jgi:hypothetical protein